MNCDITLPDNPTNMTLAKEAYLSDDGLYEDGAGDPCVAIRVDDGTFAFACITDGAVYPSDTKMRRFPSGTTITLTQE